MTNNDSARAYLDYYLDQSGDPDFAVMLEGPWGSGKSFFIEDYLAGRLASARKGSPAAKPAIRVSLFGVTDIAEIQSEMFAKAHPWLTGVPANIINTVISKAATLYGVSLDPKENRKLLQETMRNLQKRVLVFDDLERCSLPIVEVLGFINRFVEQDKTKVIVIASEEDIPAAQQEDYKARKEKVIGKTLRVASEAGTVLDIFAAELKVPEARRAIAAQRQPVLATFAALGRPNFRSLRAILTDFDRLLEVADSRLHASEGALAPLLLYMLAVGMEFRGNGIDAAGLRRLSDDIRLRLFRREGPEAPERQRARVLTERYPLVNWQDPVVPPTFLAELFASGTVRATELNAHLLRHPLVVGLAATPAWRAMWGVSDLKAADYAKVRAELVKQLNERSIVHPGELLHVVGSTLRLRQYGDDLLGGTEPATYFQAYIDDLGRADKLIAYPGLLDYGAESFDGLGYPARETTEFRSILDSLRTAESTALARKMTREAPALLERLRQNPEEYAALYEVGPGAHNYGSLPILHNIAVGDFADLLLVDHTLNRPLLSALGERYRRAQHNKGLDAEKTWMRELHAELTNRLRLSPAPHRCLGEERLNYWSKEVLEWAASPAPTQPSSQAFADESMHDSHAAQ